MRFKGISKVLIISIAFLSLLEIFLLVKNASLFREQKIFKGEYLTFEYPQSWKPSKGELVPYTIFEVIDLGIADVNGTQQIWFSKGHASHAFPPDTVHSEIVTLDTIMGYKWTRKGEGGVTYEYSAAYDDDHFHIRVTVPVENRILESQLVRLVESHFKNK